MIAYRAMLDVPTKLVRYVAKLLRAEGVADHEVGGLTFTHGLRRGGAGV